MSDVIASLRNKTVLVVDDSVHHRRIFGEVLRAIGIGDIAAHGSVNEAVETLERGVVGLAIVDWQMEPICGLTFTRNIRNGVHGDHLRRLPIVLATAAATPAQLDTIQNAGPDEYLLKPFTMGAMLARLKAVLFNRRIFIESHAYTGPCRRRRWSAEYEGPLRRLFDDDPEEKKTQEQELKRKLAATKIHRAVELMRDLNIRDRQKIREIYEVAREIQKLGEEAADSLLKVAAESMAQYIVGVGATPRFDVKVVQTHCEAMQQLVMLPNVSSDIRQKLSEALYQLTARKMRV